MQWLLRLIPSWLRTRWPLKRFYWQQEEIDASRKSPFWPKFWLEEQDGRMMLCRKSHPELPEDDNIDYIDCDYAFEDKP